MLKPMILCALTLVLFTGAPSLVVVPGTGPFLVEIHHNGKLININAIAAAIHLMIHPGDHLPGPCIPPICTGT